MFFYFTFISLITGSLIVQLVYNGKKPNICSITVMYIMYVVHTHVRMLLNFITSVWYRTVSRKIGTKHKMNNNIYLWGQTI